MPKPSQGEPTTTSIRFLLERLDAYLQQEYGQDFAYKICGEGKTLAASNLVDGRITPQGGRKPRE